ncbi:hypothetical protein ACNTMW_30215 [Planosporangium sp. 12N6]|uniref:hypothetical protein n=1 Tax=Planosporangium spinosum TaxID=3402278 RepID=UPI003CFABF52
MTWIPADSVEIIWGGGLVLGADLGVFYRAPGHADRTVPGSSLPTMATMQVKAGPLGVTLRAATHGRGIWSYDRAAAAVRLNSSRR